MKKIIRTNADNIDFNHLIKLLDIELRQRYADMQDFFDQFNKVLSIKHVVVAYINKEPVGCGAIKKYSLDTVELKRMFVKKDFRNQGVAKEILKELEAWAKELGISCIILETGDLQHEAIDLYKKKEYYIIPNYGQYVDVVNSICMKKLLLQN